MNTEMQNNEEFVIGHLPEERNISPSDLIDQLTRKPRVRALGVVSGDTEREERSMYAHVENTGRNHLTVLKTRNSIRATMRRNGVDAVEMPALKIPTVHFSPAVREKQLKLYRPENVVRSRDGDGAA
ncbi:hypothetical protein COU78_00185 [Candidatus Peregrinibacteria bacterium CG10_big_fil_rev_8_21_14_0_10_49_24]|nr:MAG: hypothetical protein COV83_06230 [Candidatus Peregrinibacteria bacterium CG11_big_fil_rev_8_21_14_0_20_49_14]PIR51607.1 MAG: hypothetical protein COU78_00185 [Candidatus Peregrinibacteria bacterium CG10_big_fil_rev_8_21_14_0_10_49_24]PJA68032.1 MAG: hypothetical protein CO157_01775 [Candidatus Peregrinibacteria bacterium CG_4_9_14_3_um_filter_49_12]